MEETVTDSRNWKCFFGIHQYEVIDKYTLRTFSGRVAVGLPDKIRDIYTLQCLHCGKLKRQKI